MGLKLKRYAVKVDFYVYAKSDDDAIYSADERAREIDLKYDNQANVMEINEIPYGSLKSRKIK